MEASKRFAHAEVFPRAIFIDGIHVPQVNTQKSVPYTTTGNILQSFFASRIGMKICQVRVAPCFGIAAIISIVVLVVIVVVLLAKDIVSMRQPPFPPPAYLELKDVVRLGSLGVRFDGVNNSVTSVNTDNLPLTDDQVACLEDWPSLQFAFLHGPRLTGRVLQFIRRNTSLEHLILMIPELEDADLEFLDGLTNLKYLVVRGGHVNDRGIEHIGKIKSLESLELEDVNLTDKGLHYLVGLTNLEYLRLTRTPITDAGLPQVVALRRLRELRLKEVPVTDRGLEVLVDLQTLRVLGLYGAKITGAGLVNAFRSTQSSNLERLDVRETLVRKADVEPLRHKLPKLTIFVEQSVIGGDEGTQ